MEIDDCAIPGAMPQGGSSTLQGPARRDQLLRKRQIDEINELSMTSLPGNNKRLRIAAYAWDSNEPGSWDNMSDIEDETAKKTLSLECAVTAEAEQAIEMKRLRAEVTSLNRLVDKERSQHYSCQNERDFLQQRVRELRTENHLYQTHLRESQAAVERLRGARSEVVLLTPHATKTDEEHLRSLLGLNQKVKDLAQHLLKTYPALAAGATSGLRRRDHAQWWLNDMLNTVIFKKYLAAVQLNICRIIADLASEIPVQHRNIWKAMTAKALNAHHPLEDRKRQAAAHASNLLSSYWHKVFSSEVCLLLSLVPSTLGVRHEIECLPSSHPIKTRHIIERIIFTAVELQWDIVKEGKDLQTMWAQPGDMFDPNWMENVRPANDDDEPDFSVVEPKKVKKAIAFGVRTSAAVLQKCSVALEE
ncbi:hypothetical protein FFLO_02602 [Filobasidium floriforme]|uniref:Uncharacterized protein n=1 Tax=Filobasidium floriforme TaxID=5210 RepID=A0A8K0NTW3_9TREE|nr:uncharacterized protein HD553DRAFT_348931 [Filobasidium floriforme]KAG7561962.1 hypothetical protein FFLO_02602 [Filobasidium floriforme]KAH8087462.1 hypothetical protein HD553DRAFT_348931 [Filobasidium floriforme]